LALVVIAVFVAGALSFDGGGRGGFCRLWLGRCLFLGFLRGLRVRLGLSFIAGLRGFGEVVRDCVGFFFCFSFRVIAVIGG